MSKVTPAKAAQMAGVSKRTIQNKISTGKLSASRDENGYYSIDVSEILRVYPDANDQLTVEHFSKQDKNIDYKAKSLVLESKNAGLQAQINLLQSQLEKSEARENKLLASVSNTTKLLEHESKSRRKKFLGIF